MELAIRNISQTYSNGVQALPLKVRRGKRRRWSHEVPGDLLFRDGLPDRPPIDLAQFNGVRGLSTCTAAFGDNGGYARYFFHSPIPRAGITVIKSLIGPSVIAAVVGAEIPGVPIGFLFANLRPDRELRHRE